MTTPEPLVLTDASGDTLTARTSLAGHLNVTVDEDEPATVLLDRSQARQLVRWLAAWLGEPPALAVQPDVFTVPTTDGTTTRTLHIANRTLPPCPRCGAGIHAGAFVAVGGVDRDGREQWEHDECGPLAVVTAPATVTDEQLTAVAAPVPPTIRVRRAPGDATVTHVEHDPVLPPAVSKTAPDAERP